MKALEISQKYRTRDQRSVRFKRDLANDIKEYARKKCKKQRELCSRNAFDKVLDAPEPEMD